MPTGGEIVYDKIITLRTTPEDRARLGIVAHVLGMKPSDTIRHLIAEEYSRIERIRKLDIPEAVDA